jgi:large exoprotein involved in heme utilization and adhesion
MNMRKHPHPRSQTNPDYRLNPLSQSVRLALLPGLLLGLGSGAALAAPTGGNVKAGIASITQNASKSLTTINQSSARAAINWTTFNVKANQLVNFKQPNARASTLNRIF